MLARLAGCGDGANLAIHGVLDEACGEELALEDEFFGEVVVEVDEEFALGDELGTPFVAVKFHDALEVFF